jgi:creatinine amidohydrolase/Fe(II)-dependent formamide hydrolase-like protein
MIAAALAALKGLSIVQWLWVNRTWLKWVAVGLVFAALTGLWQWERHDRLAAQKGETAALLQLDLARADADRWKAASDQRDQVIAELKVALDRQNAAVLRLQFSLDRANEAAARAADDDRAQRAALDQRIQQLEDEAHAHPDQVVPIGPLVRGRVDRLWN